MTRRPARARAKAHEPLPPTLRAAWGLQERDGRGPKPTLTLARVVDAAVALAADEGLEAVSMGRLAARLDVATMSLYRYVRAKEELLALMVDSVFAAAAPARAAGENWRTGLARWTRAHLQLLLRHPWVVRVPLSGPPAMPNQMRWFEHGIACLAATGISGRDKLSVLLLLNGFVRNEALLRLDLQQAAIAAGTTERDAFAAYGRLLARLLDARTFPALSALVGEGVFDQATAGDDEDAFEFGLERILDGIETLTSRQRASRPNQRKR